MTTLAVIAVPVLLAAIWRHGFGVGHRHGYQLARERSFEGTLRRATLSMATAIKQIAKAMPPELIKAMKEHDTNDR